MTAGRRSSRAALLPFAVAALVFGAACDPVDGTGVYALWEVCEHPTGAFHFHYLEPPWEPAPGFAAAAPVFLLDPSGEPASAADDPGARVRLEAYPSEAGSVADEAAARRAHWQLAGFTVDAPQTFTNRAGDLGIVQRAALGESRIAEVFFDGAAVVGLSLWGRGSIAGEDYRMLLESFEPRASGAP